ncbi:Alpha/Beta hydrolase protein [Aspergillus carlsbadensis]|nr:Alpha/Beta hydrolase protein [Aspergillus carlsbadensis]
MHKWEGPDPAFWCAHEYAIVNVDIRGGFSAEGDLHFFGQQEAQDGSEFITWVSKQPWCNGKVALTGNSWLAIAQWRIGSLRPEGLAALAPWEGFSDMYRHNICEGGVPFWGFHNLAADALVSQGKLEDPAALLKSDPLRNSYWEDKTADPGLITTPIYVPDTTPKWLRVHNKQEWSDYYDDDAQKDLKRFFDFYLHGRTDNGWASTPPVRLSILHLGLGSLDDTVNRPENEFPIARTRYVRHFLTAKGGLSLKAPSDSGIVSYGSENGRAVFRYRIPRSCETTGYFMAHLIVSCEATEMDLFVQVEKLSPANRRQGTLVIKPQSALVRGAIKTMHDWQIGLDKAGPLLHCGPDGVLRGSHSVTYDASRSSPCQPFYTHDTKRPFDKGEIRALDLQIRPYGMYWEKDDVLQFTVAGKSVLPFPFPVELQQTENSGKHNIHCGGRGEESSDLLLPFV